MGRGGLHHPSGVRNCMLTMLLVGDICKPGLRGSQPKNCDCDVRTSCNGCALLSIFHVPMRFAAQRHACRNLAFLYVLLYIRPDQHGNLQAACLHCLASYMKEALNGHRVLFVRKRSPSEPVGFRHLVYV